MLEVIAGVLPDGGVCLSTSVCHRPSRPLIGCCRGAKGFRRTVPYAVQRLCQACRTGAGPVALCIVPLTHPSSRVPGVRSEWPCSCSYVM